MNEPEEDQPEREFKAAFPVPRKRVAQKIIEDNRERHEKAQQLVLDLQAVLKEHKPALSVMTFNSPYPGAAAELPKIVPKAGKESVHAKLDYMNDQLRHRLASGPSRGLEEDNQQLAYLADFIEAFAREGATREVQGMRNLSRTEVTEPMVKAATSELFKVYDRHKDMVNQHYGLCRGD